jgi:tetratricopeptide (TPR) repeat protein
MNFRPLFLFPKPFPPATTRPEARPCKMGRFQDAFETFKIAGNEASAYYNIGCFYMIEKKYQEAIRSYQKAIDAKPEFYVEAYETMNKAKAALAMSQNRTLQTETHYSPAPLFLRLAQGFNSLSPFR